MRSWSAVYLLPYAAGPSATPDRKARGYFRHKEVMTASSSREVVGELVARQAIPVEVKELKPAHPLLERVSKSFRQQFLLTLTFGVEGGMSPGRALEQAIESETGPIRQRLALGLQMLRQGRSFVDAFRSLDLYDTTTLAIIEAGEETGKLPQALRTALGHLQRSDAAMKTIVGTVSWTVIDLAFAVSSIIGTRFGMIPYLRGQNTGSNKNAEAMNSALDLATTANDILIAITVLALVALLVGFYSYLGSNESFRAKVDAILLKTPILKDLMGNTAVANTCNVMSSLLKGGVNFIPASRIAERGTRMLSVVRYWTTARNRVESGELVSAAVSMEPFTPNERMILRSHRDVGMLATGYQTIGEQRDEKAKSAAKKFALTAFFGSLFYSSLGVLLVLYVVYIQNETAMNFTPGV